MKLVPGINCSNHRLSFPSANLTYYFFNNINYYHSVMQQYLNLRIFRKLESVRVF